MNRRNIIWTIVFLAVAIPSVVSGIVLGQAGHWDLRFFYEDAQFLLAGGDMTESWKLEWYLPGMRVLFMPLGLLSKLPAAVLWNAINLLALAVTLWATYRCATYKSETQNVTRHLKHLGLAFLMIAPILFHVFQINQISFWPMALFMLSYLYAIRNRQWLAGVFLGLAIFVKIIPALLIGWCILRKRFKMAICAAALPFLLSFAIDSACNGGTAAWKHHVHWYKVAVTGSAGTGFMESKPELNHKNQGLAVVLTRLLQPTPTGSAKPLPGSEKRRVKQIHIANLDQATIKNIYRGVIAISLLALAIYTWRVGRRNELFAEHGLWAIWCIALMWFAPLMRPYYMVWAIPALLLVLEMGYQHKQAGTYRVVCIIAIAAWLIGLIGWIMPEPRAAGCNQWANLVIMLALAWEIRPKALCKMNQPQSNNE